MKFEKPLVNPVTGQVIPYSGKVYLWRVRAVNRALDVRLRVPLLGGVGRNGLLSRKWPKLLRQVRRNLL